MSPNSTWKNSEMNQSFEMAYNNQQTAVTQSTVENPVLVPSPAPRNQFRSNNGQKVPEPNQNSNSQDGKYIIF
ncbi:hypothetical protein TNCV_264861 [Trichonephila clavipes]|nr:hypothetical protein TNCV_264861 [Trichonephila clavipes]